MVEKEECLPHEKRQTENEGPRERVDVEGQWKWAIFFYCREFGSIGEEGNKEGEEKKEKHKAKGIIE